MKPVPPRRRQVLLLVARGYANHRIARLLGIHQRTVDRHLAELYAALGARDRANAVLVAIHRGDITPAEVAGIAAEAIPRPRAGPREASGASVAASGADCGSRDAGEAAEPSGGRSALRGEAA